MFKYILFWNYFFLASVRFSAHSCECCVWSCTSREVSRNAALSRVAQWLYVDSDSSFSCRWCCVHLARWRVRVIAVKNMRNWNARRDVHVQFHEKLKWWRTQTVRWSHKRALCFKRFHKTLRKATASLCLSVYLVARVVHLCSHCMCVFIKIWRRFLNEFCQPDSSLVKIGLK
jgi:hypothetical protein